MTETPFTALVGCRHPLQQAGMGVVTTPALAAAVAGAGALGMLNLTAPPHALAAAASAVSEHAVAGGGAIGVNFLVPFLDLAAVDAVAPACRVVELFYGAPDAHVVARIHAGGALACWQVGEVEEARAAVDAGCDLVVAQGVEAGGHVRGQRALRPLLDDVLDAVDVPVVAAGGIGTARDVATVLAAGAHAVRVGTRFVAATESAAHPAYVDALCRAGADDTVLTDMFSVMWPDAPHRVLRSCVDALRAHGPEPVGETLLDGHRVTLPAGAVTPPSTHTEGDIAAMALYAGKSVAAVQAVQPAAEIVAELLAEVTA